MREPKTTTDQPAIAEQRPYLFRCRIGRNIEVLGMQLQHGIPHATAHQKGLVPRFVQSIQDLERAVSDLLAGDIVVGAGNDLWRLLASVIPAFVQIASVY